MPNYFVDSDANEVLVHTGTARDIADTAYNYICLSVEASVVNDFYNTNMVEVISGTGAGQSRYIIDYDGPNQKVFVSSNWAIKPDSTSVYRIVKRTLIADGEIPTASVLNRPYFSLVNNDLNLDQVSQFLTRSTVLNITDKTKFLAHFNKDGADIVSNILPDVEQTAYDSSLYVKDNMFFGVAWPQGGSITNVLSNATSDTSLRDASNWGLTKSAEVDASVMHKDEGLCVSTKGLNNAGNFGAVTLSSTNAVLSSYVAPYNVASMSIEYTNSVLFDPGTSLEFGVHFYNNSNALFDSMVKNVSVLPTGTGRLELNNFTMSTPPVGTTSVYIKAYIKVTYGANAVVDLQVRNFMVEQSPFSHTYVSGVRTPAISFKYDDLISTPTLFSVMFWTKLRDSVANAQTYDYGPIYLEATGDTIGIISDVTSAAKRTVRIARNISGTPTYSAGIDLDDGDHDAYFPMLLRADAVSNKLELLVINSNGTLYKTSLPYSTAVTKYTLKVGTCTLYPTLYECPITELRYDNEWISDLEFRLVALAAHPFGKPFLPYEATPDIRPRPNLIRNPDGKLDTLFWAPTIGLYSYRDDTSGYHIRYNASTTNTALTIPQTFKVLSGAGLQYTFSAYIGANLVTGGYGIVVKYYNGASCIASYTKYAVNSSVDNYYTFTTTAPVNTTYVEFGLTVDSGTTIANGGFIKWANLKAELGATDTEFTRDNTPQYAVIAP